jgi:hypothetical protein
LLIYDEHLILTLLCIAEADALRDGVDTRTVIPLGDVPTIDITMGNIEQMIDEEVLQQYMEQSNRQRTADVNRAPAHHPADNARGGNEHQPQVEQVQGAGLGNGGDQDDDNDGGDGGGDESIGSAGG